MDESLQALQALSIPTVWAEAQQRFRAPHRRQEWLSVRLLLQALLNEPKSIGYLPSGKPYLIDDVREISISHTHGYVAVIVGHGTVGIDIEQYAKRVHRLSSRFIRDDEQIVPYCGDDTWSLLLHWSAKEVVFKCLETDGVDFREHLYIYPFVPSETGSFDACESRTSEWRKFVVHYLLHPDFVLTYTRP